ncbi:MAG: hypothetical protein IJ087_15695 [Eggerthellaceae bacterium]|nr:hypothetical protein [Eggerthellaceae bacterium]
MRMGTSADGRALTYDADRYEFKLGSQAASFDDVCALESRDWIRWRAPELREWFVKLDREAFIASNRAARSALRYRSSDPSVATVDAGGRVVVRGEGIAEILAARGDDVGFVSAVRLVTIVSGPTSGAREVRVSFKAKGGKLPKAKSFKLPALPPAAVGYEKVNGSDMLSVSKSGKVTVEKGAPRGLYTAEAAVRGRGDFASVVIAVEVR